MVKQKEYFQARPILGLLLLCFLLGLGLAGGSIRPASADIFPGRADLQVVDRPGGPDRPAGDAGSRAALPGLAITMPLTSAGLITPLGSTTPRSAGQVRVYLPFILKPENFGLCPLFSEAAFALVPIEGPPADHPDYLHGDLNLSLRGYSPTFAFPGLVDYSGGADPNAPKLAGLFEPAHFPGIRTIYRVNHWLWNCGSHGCRGGPVTSPEVTLVDLVTVPGETIYVPERSPEIFGGGAIAMVLYAEDTRITLAYTRRDSVAPGYAIHLENVCVDPNLLALYRSQTDAYGWHVTGYLPTLRHRQALGSALGTEIQAAIRDRGTFMDPRSRKDWW